jgi:PAS domain S-box-containing protein
MQAPIPDAEGQRLHSLRQYHILDTLPQAEFDDIVHLASHICETPIALISLVDQSRQWFKARKGLDAQQTARELSFCAHAILQPDELLVVTDTFADQRFRNNDLVTGEPHIRFYAGAPLVMSDGMALGTLCVIDRVPRQLTENQRAALNALRRSVVNALELRRLSSDASARRLILYDVLHQLARELDVDVILRKALNAIRQINRWDSIGISLPTANGQFWQTRVEDRMAEGEVSAFHTIYSGVIGRVYRTGEIQFVADVSADPNYFHGDHEDQVGSELAIPIKFEGEVLGVLNLEAHRTQAFTQDDIDFAQSITEIIAIALKNAQQFISLKHEISRRVQVEKHLRDALIKLESAESQAGLGSWSLDLENGNFWCSKELQRLLGYDPVEGRLSKEELLDGVHPEDREIAAGAQAQVLRGEIPEVRDFRTNPKHGAVRILAPRYQRQENEAGQAVRVQGTLLDITERKQAEEAARESEARFATIFRQSPAGVAITSLRDAKLVDVNDVWLRLWGYAREEVVGRTALELGLWANPQDRLRLLEKLATHGHVADFESIFFTKSGVQRDVLLYAGQADVNNEPMMLIQIIDITERKKAEQALAESEARYRQAIIAADAIPYAVDYATDEYIFGREMLLERLGYDVRKTTPGMRSSIYIESVVLGAFKGMPFQDALVKMRQGQAGDFWKAEHRLLTSTGEERWFLDSAIQILDANQRPTSSIGILQDITERKQAEIELQLAKSRLQHLLTSSPAVIYSNKASGDYGATFISDNVRILTGYEPEDFTGDPAFWVTKIHPDDLSTVLAEMSQIQAHETHNVEYRFLHRDGSYRWTRDEARLVLDAAGNPAEIIGSWVNITKRKEAETARNAERALRQAIEDSLYSGICAINMDGVQIYANPAFCTMVGWPAEELVGPSAPFVYWPPEEIELITSSFNQALAAKVPAGGIELILMRRDGERFPVQLLLSPLYADEEQIGWLANVIDITERKAAESQLRAERVRFKRLFELAPDGIMIVDSAGCIQLANPALHQMLGLQEDTLPAAKIYDFVYSDYRSYCEDCLLAVIHRGQEVERSELIFVSAGEERFPVEIDAGFFVWNGEPAAQVVVRDITDRKRAELLEIEQRHIAYELHDGLAQIVAGAHQHLQSFAHHYRPRSPRTRQELASVLSMTQNAVKEVRRVMAGLRPTALDDFGLATALRLQVQALEVEGWEIDYEAPASTERLPSTVETVLFRIAQEALNNIRKHAQGARVRVVLKFDDEHYRLEIQDWGRGFDLANLATVAPGKHLGLRGMQERIVLVGGRLNIHSSPGAGTHVVAEAPRKIKE